MTLGDVPNKQRKVSPFKTSNSEFITLTLSRFKEKLNPASPVPGELQERLPFMAAVGQTPDMPWKEMSVGACHAFQPAYNVVFDLKTGHLRLFFGPFFMISYFTSTGCFGPTLFPLSLFHPLSLEIPIPYYGTRFTLPAVYRKSGWHRHPYKTSNPSVLQEKPVA